MSLTEQDREMTLFSLPWPVYIEPMLHLIMGGADTLMQGSIQIAPLLPLAYLINF